MLLSNADNIQLFGTAAQLKPPAGTPDLLAAGQRAEVRGRLINQLGTGRYFLDLGVNREHSGVDNVVWISKATDFLIYGNQKTTGMIALHNEFDAEVEK